MANVFGTDSGLIRSDLEPLRQRILNHKEIKYRG
jgi:hypothetical protein